MHREWLTHLVAIPELIVATHTKGICYGTEASHLRAMAKSQSVVGCWQANRAAEPAATEQAAEAAKKEKAAAQSQQENTNTKSNNPTNVLGNVNSVIGTIKQIQSIGGIIGGSGHGHHDHPEEDPDTALVCDENGVCLPQN